MSTAVQVQRITPCLERRNDGHARCLITHAPWPQRCLPPPDTQLPMQSQCLGGSAEVFNFTERAGFSLSETIHGTCFTTTFRRSALKEVRRSRKCTETRRSPECNSKHTRMRQSAHTQQQTYARASQLHRERRRPYDLRACDWIACVMERRPGERRRLYPRPRSPSSS